MGPIYGLMVLLSNMYIYMQTPVLMVLLSNIYIHMQTPVLIQSSMLRSPRSAICISTPQSWILAYSIAGKHTYLETCSTTQGYMLHWTGCTHAVIENMPAQPIVYTSQSLTSQYKLYRGDTVQQGNI